MRPEQQQRPDDAMRAHTEDVATAAGRHQPTGHDDDAVTRAPDPEPTHRGKPDPITEHDEPRPGFNGKHSMETTERDESRAEPGTPAMAEDVDRAEEPRADAEAAATPGPEQDGEEPDRLFDTDDADRFRTRWQEIQARFVDDPREAVRGADQLLDEALRSITERKQELEGRWQQGSGDNDQTEHMRLTLRRYRTVLNHLLDA